MPIVEDWLERVHGSLYRTLSIAYGIKNVVAFQLECASQFFVLERLRMEIIECCPEDLPRLRSCIVRLIVGNKTYWKGPASRLILEDWLRKELRNIKKGRNRQIDKYLGRVLGPSFGGLELMHVTHADQIWVEVDFDHPYAWSGNSTVRFFLEGLDYRHIQ